MMAAPLNSLIRLGGYRMTRSLAPRVRGDFHVQPSNASCVRSVRCAMSVRPRQSTSVRKHRTGYGHA
jgi:hypothetical protein